MTFLDRADELARVLGAGEDHFESALIVTGPAGIGKTRLLEQAVEVATVRTALITLAAAESEWPLSGFSRLFAALDDPRAIEFSGRFTLRSTEPQQMFQAARDLLSLLRGLRLEPILLMIDDADLMDRESLHLLGYMAGRLAGTGIRLVGASRRLPEGEVFQAAPRLEIPPLGREESLALLASKSPPTADRGVLEIICDQCGGVPAVLLEKADTLTLEQFEGAVSVPLPLKHSNRVLGDLPDTDLALGPAHRHMLQKISLQACANIDVLTDDADDADTIDDLINAGLVIVKARAVRVAGPLLRSRLYWGIEPKVRRRMHADLAQASVDYSRRLAVWHSSFTMAEDEDCARELFNAAAEYERGGDRAIAVEFAERAIAIAPAPNDLLGAILALVDAFFRHGELPIARRYLLHAHLGADRAAGAFTLAEVRAALDYTATGILQEHDIDTTVAVHGTRNVAGATRLLLDAAYWHTERRDFAAARQNIRRADANQRIQPFTESAQRLRDGVVRLIDAFDRPQDVRVADVDTTSLRDLLIAGDAASISESYGLARRLYAVAIARLEESNALWLEGVWFRSVINEIRAGSMKRAREAYVEWHRYIVVAPHLGDRSSRTMLRAWYSLSTGDYDGAKVLFPRAIAAASVEGNMSVAATGSAILGTLAIAEGRFEHARRLLDDADATSSAMPNPGVVRHIPDLALAQIMTGNRAAAERTLARLESVREVHPSRWIELAIPATRAIVATGEASLELFREALEAFRDDDSRYQLARTWEMYARRQSERGETDEAAHSHSTARSIYQSQGANAWIGAVPLTGEREAGDTAPANGSRIPNGNVNANANGNANANVNGNGNGNAHANPYPGSDLVSAANAGSASLAVLEGLNDEERRVVELVVRGLRNKEIAATLFVSVRTVELRLTRIYRKAGARSRSHLVALLN